MEETFTVYLQEKVWGKVKVKASSKDRAVNEVRMMIATGQLPKGTMNEPQGITVTWARGATDEP